MPSTAERFERDVLVCYRGRYRRQVERLVAEIERAGLTVGYDTPILEAAGVPPATDPFAADDAGERWRAPLEAAIRSSELVVFLVPNANDISDNVWDEISWVATNSRHIFVVFDVRFDLDEEGEAVLIAAIQLRWRLTTITVEQISSGASPSVPDFPYHVVSHADERHIDEQIRTLANRVVVALENYRNGRIRSSDAPSDVTMEDVRNSPGRRRRRRLHEVQAEAARRFGLESPAPGRDPLREVTDRLAERERELTPSGDVLVAPDGFRFPADLERARFARAHAMAERMRPSVFENPTVFATLCLEAAGVELLLEEEGAPAAAVMWGTLPFSTVEAPAWAAPGGLLFWIDRAFVDLGYQAAKSSVMTWSTSDGGIRIDPVEVGDRLARDPTPALAFVDSLHHFGTEGRPSSTTAGPPAPEIRRPIGLLTKFSERYLMSYGYLLATSPDASPDRDALAADAATVTMRTGLSFDRVDPSIGLQGAVHAEACLSLAWHSRLGPGERSADRRDDYVNRVATMAHRCRQLYVLGGADPEFAETATAHACDAGSTPLVLAELAGFFRD